MGTPQYTYKDYLILLDNISNIEKKKYLTFHLIHIRDMIKKYIFKENEYDINTIPPGSELLLFLIFPPYKNLIFDIPFEDIPLELNNTHDWSDDIVKWRLQIGK